MQTCRKNLICFYHALFFYAILSKWHCHFFYLLSLYSIAFICFVPFKHKKVVKKSQNIKKAIKNPETNSEQILVLIFKLSKNCKKPKPMMCCPTCGTPGCGQIAGLAFPAPFCGPCSGVCISPCGRPFGSYSWRYGPTRCIWSVTRFVN